ncbi:protein FAM227B-like isoform X1 [Lytechinus variegatus]|uniref:protein FAM227B-like isoform X1 n=1 Tax=Lytechinus variegatus TaxID=7654 RepID=UPI001BB0E6E3|nr:protein FAM227B-like isoform X1 [Lytechinus variegatus]XP_041465234.1 protein FAM227B-like isoform X1 [Lytechinus variegatus]XP_041465235.1 protein FAM227B-like isoform X1 [Lytechinus variegatus]XP_041465236.1 protein FAM227B-like isoform X1 [Lytechinus variegatus]
MSSSRKRNKEDSFEYPVQSFEEWLERERSGMDWPIVEMDKMTLDLKTDKGLLGTHAEIVEALSEYASFPIHILDNLEAKVDRLQERLDLYATQVVTDDGRSSRLQNELFHSPAAGPVVYKPVMQRAANSDMVKAHRVQEKDNSTELRALILGSKARSLEVMSYPGFNKNELTELPHGLEAPQILDRVTRAQDFNAGFNKFWKKLFLSEASVAVMQDMFWWFFIDKYEPKREEEKKKIFNRIADSFVALFVSVNPEIKDKFFVVYADCLAQAIFAAYWEAFIDSHHQLGDRFKQNIASICSELTAGVKPKPLSWKHWDVKRLQPKSMNKEKEEDKHRVVLIKEGHINKDADFSINVDIPDESDSLANELGSTVSREMTLLNKGHRFPQTIATNVEGAQTEVESHQIGPGPDFERVLFNIKGRSPLVAHYLHMRQLAGNQNIGRNVRRTEVEKLPPPAPTYREVIKDSNRMAKAMSTEYQKISDILNKELAAIEKQRAQQAREIEALKSQILQRSYDTKILSEKILDFRESGNRNYHNVLDFNDYVKGKEGIVTIMKQDKAGRARTRPRSMKTESSAEEEGEDENEEDPADLDEGT